MHAVSSHDCLMYWREWLISKQHFHIDPRSNVILGTDDRFRRHIVLHEQIWVHRVYVKRTYPVVLADHHILHITARVFSLFFDSSCWNRDLALAQIAVNDRVPDRSGTQCIDIVDTANIRNRQRKSNQTEFVLKAFDQFDVLQVIVEEQLRITVIQFLQRAVILNLIITQHNLSNMRKPVGFLVAVSMCGKLLK